MTYHLFHKYKRYDVETEPKIENNKTIQKHKKEIDNNGFVWWGVIQKTKIPKAPIGEQKINLLNNQLKNNNETKVYFIESKTSINKNEIREAYCAILAQIKTFPIPELYENCPAYYENLEYSKSRLWLKLISLEKIELNNSMLGTIIFESSILELPFIEEIDINQNTLRLLKEN